MKGWIISVSIIGVILVCLFMIGGMFVSIGNKEVDLATAIQSKQLDNNNEFDSMYKKISQVSQVSEKQLSALKDIFVSYADARTPDKAGSVMQWVTEAIPNVDTSTLNNLQNIITSSRDSWTMRQKELIDLNREHNVLLRKFPSSIILSIMGRKEINIQIVTSSRTEKAFETGKDDDTDVFKK
jgi:hypothetical protein